MSLYNAKKNKWKKKTSSSSHLSRVSGRAAAAEDWRRDVSADIAERDFTIHGIQSVDEN